MSAGLIRDVLGAGSGEIYPSQCAGFTSEHLAIIAERARARGESAFDVKEVEEQVIAPIFYNILFGRRELTADYCRSLLDRVQSLQPKVERDQWGAVRDQERSR